MKGILSKVESVWGVKKEFRLKVFFLATSFFMLMVCQAIWRPLKNAVFLTMVGVKQIPTAKMLLIFPVIILIIIYSKLVDWLRRHHLFYWFTITFALIGFVMCYFLIHPVYGIANTTKSAYRLFGWIFYFYMESFGAFMSAVFWSFANSVNKPKDAKNYYSIFVTGSKLGGMLGAGTLYYIAACTNLTSLVLVPSCLAAGCFALLGAATSIFMLMKFVPGYLMHGYEAAYQYEKKKKKEKTSIWKSIKQAFDGILSIFKNPYVFGIFAIIMSYETIIVIIDYLVSVLAAKNNPTAGGLISFFSLYMLLMHSLGLLIALFGTAPIQRFLGVRISLFVNPLVCIIALPIIFFFPNINVLFYSLIILRAFNYGLNHPTREALFIPTTKAIKFKAKAWTDAFGSRISKASGSFMNKYLLMGFVRQSSLFCLAVSFLWLPVAYLLGKKYFKAISNNEVIGAENNE